MYRDGFLKNSYQVNHHVGVLCCYIVPPVFVFFFFPFHPHKSGLARAAGPLQGAKLRAGCDAPEVFGRSLGARTAFPPHLWWWLDGVLA